MGTYSGMAPEIMQARQFGGLSAVQDSSYDTNAPASAASPAGARPVQSTDTIRTLATVDQATRKSAM